MTIEQPGDPLFELLAQLPAGTPGGGRQDRVRARCHAALARSRRHGRTGSRGAALLDAAALGAAGLYLAAAIATALRAAGFP
jgi:hypothetical protein